MGIRFLWLEITDRRAAYAKDGLPPAIISLHSLRYDHISPLNAVADSIEECGFENCTVRSGAVSPNAFKEELMQAEIVTTRSHNCKQGCKTAIGFTMEIDCIAANGWTEDFYTALLAGKTVEEAVDEAS